MKQLFQSNHGNNFTHAIDAIVDDIKFAECMFFAADGTPTVYPDEIRYVYFPTQKALTDYTAIEDALMEYMGCALPRFTEHRFVNEVYADNEGDWVLMGQAKILKTMTSFIHEDDN